MKRLRRMLAEVWASPRPLELTFAGLVLAAVFVYIPVRLTFGATEAESAQRPIVIREPVPPFPTGDLRDGSVLSLPDSIGSLTRRGEDSNKRNLFAFGTPVPTIRPTVTRTPTIVRENKPPPTPRPTPSLPRLPPWKCPLTLLGLGTHPDFPFAWFKDDDGNIYVARQGGVVDVMKDDEVKARCELQSVQLDKVVLVNPENHRQEKTLSLETKAN